MILSKFGEKFTKKTGILQLMDDLGEAINSEQPVNMLGGGNPAAIDEVNQYFQKSFESIKPDFLESVGNYSTPQGDKKFIKALVEFLNRNYDWGISDKNIALTNGSQNAFFYLFNLFSGEYPDGTNKKILLPLAPEYIGYSDVHTSGSHFIATKPIIEEIEYEGMQKFFKYRVDFDKLEITDDIGAICCSRPTNPTGNVLTNNEIKKLEELAEKNNIPFIIDNAYGLPFPNILFTDTNLKFKNNMILCMSLSKIGLPGLRTGIVIANDKVIKSISSLNAIVNLSPTRFGAAIATPLLKDDSIKYIANNIIQPFYKNKVKYAISLLKKELSDYPMYIHKPEGAIFLWIWFKDLPITTVSLYQQLKDNGTIIIPGEHFFPGVENVESWKHSKECIRISYAQNDEILKKGIAMISKFVKNAYDNKS